MSYTDNILVLGQTDECENEELAAIYNDDSTWTEERVMWKKGSGQLSGDVRVTKSVTIAISSREGNREGY